MAFSTLVFILNHGWKVLLYRYLKEGDVDNVNNYLGITLVSCMSKLFTAVLNRRTESFCVDYNFIPGV